MPSTPSGYVLPAIYFAVPGTTIRADQHNRPLEDLAAGVNDSLARDGSRPMTGNLPMAGRKITGLASGTAAADAVRFDQLPRTSGWTRSLANLTLAANQIPYATSATEAAAANMTPFARTILDDANAGAVRNTLGLGAGATFSIATQAQAEAGTDNGSLMSPLRVDQWGAKTSIGMGQSWQNVEASRVAGTSYRNTTGRPIMVSVRLANDNTSTAQVSTNNSSWVSCAWAGNEEAQSVSFIVPNMHYYRVFGSLQGPFWAELR